VYLVALIGARRDGHNEAIVVKHKIRTARSIGRTRGPYQPVMFICIALDAHQSRPEWDAN
jgi:hypothetical protein